MEFVRIFVWSSLASVSISRFVQHLHVQLASSFPIPEASTTLWIAECAFTQPSGLLELYQALRSLKMRLIVPGSLYVVEEGVG